MWWATRAGTDSCEGTVPDLSALLVSLANHTEGRREAVDGQPFLYDRFSTLSSLGEVTSHYFSFAFSDSKLFNRMEMNG